MELTFREKQVILGTLLGDASISLSSKISARIKVLQGENQKSLTNWKYKELKRLVKTEPKIVPNAGYGKNVCTFSTLSYPSLLEIYHLVRPNGKKEVNSEWLKTITDPIALAVWYMDDGSQGYSGMNIHTEGFLKEEVEMLVEWLKSVWKVDCKPVSSRNKYWLIGFSAEGRNNFQNIVRPYIIPSFRYKLILKLENIYCSMCGKSFEVNRQQFSKRKKVLLCGAKECSKKSHNLYRKIWLWRKNHE